MLASLAAVAFAALGLINGAQALPPTGFLNFGGVNHKTLQFMDQREREWTISQLVDANVRVVRLFVQGWDELKEKDFETSIGEFDHSILDRYDDTLEAIHRISKGKMKVLLSPHNIHSLRAKKDKPENGIPCDAYCEKSEGYWLDFYVRKEFRDAYKNRLFNMFNRYKSKNFGGKPWSQLNQVIMGVDIQNEPFGGVYPIPNGETWICDIATHLKHAVGFGENQIAVISGGLSGATSLDGEENWPDWVFGCDAVDVVAIHGYYAASDKTSAGTPWAKLFTPGTTLVSRSFGNKLLLVEELSFGVGPSGPSQKPADIWDQAAALNFRGIPWIYSSIARRSLPTTGEVSLEEGQSSPMEALAYGLHKATISPSHFDWTQYMPSTSGITNKGTNESAQKQKHSFTELSTNPYYPRQDRCFFGCTGWLCDAADACQPSHICRNNICEPCTSATGSSSTSTSSEISSDTSTTTILGCPGATCNSKKPCQPQYACHKGTCQPCAARHSASCTTDTAIRPVTGNTCDNTVLHDPFCEIQMGGFCQFCDKRTRSTGSSNSSSSQCRGAPCVKAADCDTDEMCDWGFCKPCTVGCLGMECTVGRDCKSGFCNRFQKCDFPGKTNVPPEMKVQVGMGGRQRPPPRGAHHRMSQRGNAVVQPQKVVQVARPLVPQPDVPKATGAQ